jgi:hypothetical protein
MHTSLSFLLYPKKKHMKQEDPLLTFASSSLASMIARTVTFPLDTYKTRLQNSSILATLNSRTMFQGLGVTLLFSVPASAVYLSTYDGVKSELGQRGYCTDSFVTHTVAAFSAEGLAGILFTPMEVLKQKMQVNGKKSTTIGTIKDTFNRHGFKGFYRGYLISQLVFIPYTITYFVTYEKLKSNFKEKDCWVYLSCSSISAAFAGAISNPADVIKTRVQIASNKKTLLVVRELYDQFGLKWFTRGMAARVGWVAPSMTIQITLFELFKDHWNKI